MAKKSLLRYIKPTGFVWNMSAKKFETTGFIRNIKAKIWQENGSKSRTNCKKSWVKVKRSWVKHMMPTGFIRNIRA